MGLVNRQPSTVNRQPSKFSTCLYWNRLSSHHWLLLFLLSLLNYIYIYINSNVLFSSSLVMVFIIGFFSVALSGGMRFIFALQLSSLFQHCAKNNDFRPKSFPSQGLDNPCLFTFKNQSPTPETPIKWINLNVYCGFSILPSCRL